MNLQRLPIGYRYFYMHQHRYGWRQIGPEAFMVTDDFGNLVFAGWGAR